MEDVTDEGKKHISFLLTLNVGTNTTHHRLYESYTGAWQTRYRGQRTHGGKTKAENKEKLISRQWENRGKDGSGEKGDHRFSFLPSLDSSPLRVDPPLQIFSIMSPYYYCTAMVFILFHLFQSHTGYLFISERWQDADDMLVQRIFLYFVSSVSVKLRSAAFRLQIQMHLVQV